MTILLRNNWNGNTPDVMYDDITETLHHIKSNPSYEIIPPNTEVRPFGDLDGKVSDTLSEAEFHQLDLQLYLAFASYFQSIHKEITLFGASNFGMKKLSLRWVVPNIRLPNIDYAKEFAKDLYSRITLPPEVKPDYSVYSKHRKMRTFYTSKPNENRPFYMLQGDDIDTIITYTPKNIPLLEFELERKEEEVKPICEVEESYITQLCDCVSIESWTNYNDCQSLIFCLLSIGAEPSLLHKYCAKASNYSYKWVQSYITNYTASKNKFTIGTLKHYAKVGNPDLYKTLQKNPEYRGEMGKLLFEELTQLTTDSTTLQNWCDEKGYLKELPRENTLAVKSHLGTGKTRRVIQLCKPNIFNTNKNIVVISCRQSFTSQIVNDLKGFVDYRNVKSKGKDRSIKEEKVVIQLQSLHRVKDRKFDLVILDESETIAASLTINNTHKNYLETIHTFESILRTATKVVALDAFLSDRTTELLTALRGETKIVINPTIPYKRKAILYKEYQTFQSAIRRQLSNEKKVVCVWGAKDKAKAFHSLLSNTQLYSADTDSKLKEEHLADVNTYWKDIQCVGYTGTITVGINYTAEPSFDICGLYATPFSCLPRDYSQALHRARKLNDNLFLVHISKDLPPCSVEAGMDSINEFYELDNERRRKFITEIDKFNPTDDLYETLPSWLQNVIKRNLNEKICSKKFHTECMIGFLKLCGVTIEYNTDSSTEKKKFDPSTTISIEDVADIDGELAELYLNARISLDEKQHWELEKYFLRQKVIKIDQKIWELWLSNKRKIERAYALIYRNPRDLIKYKVIDLVPKDAERLKLIKDLNLKWESDFSFDVEDMTKIDLAIFGTRIRSEKDTPEQYCRDLVKSLEQWCGVKIKVESKRIKKNNELSYSYKVVYNAEDNIFSYIGQKCSFFEEEG
jgi:hypothetical protein